MYSRSGLVRQGVELAIHDCLGRADGVPVNRLLGGALRDRIAVCYPVFRLRATDQVPAALDRVEEKRRQGFDVIRLYVGHRSGCRSGVHDADSPTGSPAESGSSRSTSRTSSDGARRSRQPSG